MQVREVDLPNGAGVSLFEKHLFPLLCTDPNLIQTSTGLLIDGWHILTTLELYECRNPMLMKVGQNCLYNSA